MKSKELETLEQYINKYIVNSDIDETVKKNYLQALYDYSFFIKQKETMSLEEEKKREEDAKKWFKQQYGKYFLVENTKNLHYVFKFDVEIIDLSNNAFFLSCYTVFNDKNHITVHNGTEKRWIPCSYFECPFLEKPNFKDVKMVEITEEDYKNILSKINVVEILVNSLNFKRFFK